MVRRHLVPALGSRRVRDFLRGRPASHAGVPGRPENPGRLVNFARFPLMLAVFGIIPGLLRHESGWTMAAQALEAFAAGVGGQIAYLLIKTTHRVIRIRRERRGAAA
jgi:hypothetical protein